MEKLILKIFKVNNKENKDIPLPKYMTKGSSGMDICAAVKEDLVIEPKAIKIIPTALAFEIPQGFEIQIRPRSGIALKHGITLINSPATIDSDYRGEVLIPLINHGDKDFVVRRNDRIAQIVVQKIQRVEIELVSSLNETKRGDKGFGHTGKN